MSIGIYSREDIANALLGDILLLMAAAAAMGDSNVEFIRGGLSVIRSQATRFGLSWNGQSGILERARMQLDSGLDRLLDASLHVGE